MSKKCTLLCGLSAGGGRLLHRQFVTVENGLISACGNQADYLPAGEELVRLPEDSCLCAAYLDEHLHGAMLHDVLEADRAALEAICRFEWAHGVGAFLPTALTAPLDDVRRLIGLVQEFSPPVPVLLPGIHMEGPMLSAAGCGAQPPEFLQAPGPETAAFLEQYCGAVRLLTLAPELPDAAALIRRCRALGIHVSGGHDNAVGEDIKAAIDAGMDGVTHIFCCSSSLRRRPGDPHKHLGLTEYGLLCDGLYAEAIADNFHLPPDLLRLLWKVKGWRHVCLVSDSIAAAGMAPGRFVLGGAHGVPVEVTGEVALTADRRLFAGSITPLDHMVENAVRCGIPLAEAIAMASESPARHLGLDRLGRIEPGCRAVFNLVSPSGKLLRTIDGTAF